MHEINTLQRQIFWEISQLPGQCNCGAQDTSRASEWVGESYANQNGCTSKLGGYFPFYAVELALETQVYIFPDFSFHIVNMKVV